MGYIKLEEKDGESYEVDGGRVKSVETEVEVHQLEPPTALGMLLHAYLDLFEQSGHGGCSDPECPFTNLFVPAAAAILKIKEDYDKRIGKKLNRNPYNQT